MAVKTNTNVKGKNGKNYSYFRISKVVGHKINDNGFEVPVTKQFVGKSQKEAEEKYQKYVQRASQGLNDKKQYFGIVLENWINNFFIQDPHKSFNTKERYISMWKRHLKDHELSHQPLESVSAATIQQFYNNLDCPPSAIRKIHNLLRLFYRYLELEGMAHDCTSALIVPKERKKQEQQEDVIIWTDSEMSMILKGFDEADDRFRLRFLIVLAYNTGCRFGELRALMYDDIDTENKTITIKRQIVETKELGTNNAASKRTPEIAPLKSGTSYRTIPINDTVIKELKRHEIWHKKDQLKNRYRTKYIFTTASGGFLDPHNIRRSLERYYEKIGIEPLYFNDKGRAVYKSIHTYRHTFATKLVKNGIPIHVASSLLGHADINTTAKYYVGVDIDQKREAVNILEDIAVS